MTIIFTVVLLTTLASCWLVNVFFLERYYIQDKQQVLVEAYEYLDKAADQGILDTDEFAEQLNTLCETSNIRLFVMGSDGQPKIASEKDSQMLQKRLYTYLFFKIDEGKVMKSTDQYTIRMNVDTHVNEEYLEMTGTLGSGDLILIRTALEPIRESVALANRFLLYVGIIVLVIGGFLVQLMSKRIAEPILDLAKLSERMSNLDFDVKFQGGSEDEVDFLGQHMNQLSEALEKTISELKTANNELQRDIEQKEKIDEMRKEFLSNVSHELKTPIALIQGYAEGLQECVNDDEESRSFYCDVIMDEAGKMNSMVKNLLTLNELEFGNETVTMERFDLTALVHNMLQSRKILFEQKNVRLVFDVQEPVYVWADEMKLEEVLNNYISNALNHVEGENVIKITFQKQDGKVRTGVFNTGKPIPEGDMEHIWDKFYKVDKARTREYGGSGVGLSIVKAIMESMHQQYGAVNYENGVEFWLELDDRA
jgi:signal transduction histidine kinase